MESKLFTPVTFGPLTLRNRTIRSAAFESMCPGNAPSDILLDYHRSVAAGLLWPMRQLPGAACLLTASCGCVLRLSPDSVG